MIQIVTEEVVSYKRYNFITFISTESITIIPSGERKVKRKIEKNRRRRRKKKKE